MEDSPATQGKRVRADEIGEALAIAWHWRLHALVLYAFLLGGGLWLWHLSQQPRLIPVYIEVDRQGARMQVLPSGGQWYNPSQEIIQARVRECLEVMRRVSPDKERMRQDWIMLYHRVTPHGQELLNQKVKQQNPLEAPDEVRVEVLRILLPGGKTYDVQWLETTHNQDGTVKASRRFSGTFTYAFRKPDQRLTAETLKYNPDGILLDTWAFAEM